MNKKVVVIGGGTGSFTVLSGLKKYDFEITAVVASTDSGGSTGKLRDEFGYLPVGDLRQCLVALAEDNEEQYYLRELFTYRFSKGGNGLEGHNLGNLLMTALRDITGSDLKSINILEKLFNIKGKILPVTTEKTNLVAEYDNGEKIIGEANIDEPKYPHDPHAKIINLYTEPLVQTYFDVTTAILNADIIIIGPGDLYTSIIANLVIGGVKEAIAKTKSQIIYFSNLFTKFGQTTNYTLFDHVSEVEKYLGKRIDTIIVNDSEMPQEILVKYKMENAFPVVRNMLGDKRVIHKDLIATKTIKTRKGDILKRSLIRHDPEKVGRIIKELAS
ncbi:MAG: YvcK family protein [Candidatus Dojkabacteria bacterium]